MYHRTVVTGAGSIEDRGDGDGDGGPPSSLRRNADAVQPAPDSRLSSAARSLGIPPCPRM